MKPADITAPAQSEAIAFLFDLPHPPEKVWRAITHPELVSRWLLPVTGLSREPGAAFTFQTQPMPGWDGTVACRMLEVEPGRMLRYSWVVGDMELDTVVTFTLAPTETGTRLQLVQAGFRPDQKRNFGGARYGWRMMGQRLVELLDTLS